MRHHTTRTITVDDYSHTTCDQCGHRTDYPIAVLISVHEGEHGGAVDEFDYCNDCFIEKTAALAALGSTAEIVRGTE